MADLLTAFDWSRAQAFLAVAEHGSLSAAARAIGQSQPTLGRHIKSFETALGVELFHRHARGFSLTDAGARVLPAARRMHAAMSDMALVAETEASQDVGTVRIACSVHVAHYVLPQIVSELRRTAPQIDLVIDASDDSENLLFREADIALRMYRPTQLDLIARHIADIPIGAFAAISYLDTFGRPRTAQDLRDHALVGYDQSPLIRNELRRLGVAEAELRFPVRCDNQTAYWELVRAGCGIGFTQVITGRRDPMLEEIPLDFALPHLPLWITAYEPVRHIPRVATIWTALTEALLAQFA